VAPHYSIVVPSSTDVALDVRANMGPHGSSDGYQTFHYSGTLDPLHRKPLNLKPGEEFVLNVQLQRNTNPATPNSSRVPHVRPAQGANVGFLPLNFSAFLCALSASALKLSAFAFLTQI
jgi:hypothetical protein